MFMISFYVPASHLEQVKNAVFKAGAGKIGDYSCCSWQTLGEGQFMPLEGSQPYIGQKFQIEKVPEYKVEMICADHCIHDVVAALYEAHPYEQPAYNVIRVEEIS